MQHTHRGWREGLIEANQGGDAHGREQLTFYHLIKTGKIYSISSMTFGDLTYVHIDSYTYPKSFQE